MSPAPPDKSAARKIAFQARKPAHQAGVDAAAQARLEAAMAELPGNVVAAYMPIRTEISPLPVMAALHSAGRQVTVPVIIAEAQPLRFARWTPDTEMVAGPFGASIPRDRDFLVPDVLITPLVAFDARGFRLGYGGGFYDRSFQEIRAQKPAIGVGFAYDAQELPLVPTEPTDQRLDLIVTETRLLDLAGLVLPRPGA